MSVSAKRRARRLNAQIVEHVNRRVLWEQHQGICGICQEPVTLKEMTIDHRKPLCLGGDHSYANTQPAHNACNLAKGAMLPDEYEHEPIRRRQGYLNRPNLAQA